jgi:protein phosphatase
LRANADPAACADRLISLALAAGGPDNVTVIVADVTTTHRHWFR